MINHFVDRGDKLQDGGIPPALLNCTPVSTTPGAVDEMAVLCTPNLVFAHVAKERQ